MNYLRTPWDQKEPSLYIALLASKISLQYLSLKAAFPFGACLTASTLFGHGFALPMGSLLCSSIIVHWALVQPLHEWHRLPHRISFSNGTFAFSPPLEDHVLCRLVKTLASLH